MTYSVKKEEKLIKFLIHNVQGLSFGNAQKLIRLGKVKVNDKRCKDNISLTTGDQVEVYEIKKSYPTIDIVYEDDNILIVNKPAGLECATRDKSSANTYSLEEIFQEKNAIVVHRLDRLTSGLVVLARTREIAIKFERIFRTKEIQKSYTACVNGIVKDSGIKTAYLKKDDKKSKVFISDTPKDDYKEIITEYHIMNTYPDYTLCDIILHTGRTHQIRAYFAHIGHSIIGDTKYGTYRHSLESKYNGYYLCAYRLQFNISDPTLKYLNDQIFEITPDFMQYIK